MTSSNLGMAPTDMFGGMILWGMKKKKKWKIGGNMRVRGVWLGEEGKEENGGVWLFSLRVYQNLIFLN